MPIAIGSRFVIDVGRDDHPPPATLHHKRFGQVLARRHMGHLSVITPAGVMGPRNVRGLDEIQPR